MNVRLEVSHKSGKKKTVEIRSDAVIGRSLECSLRIASDEISRQHCKLTVMESGVLVRDLESANGTWVNGKMIPPNRDVALPPGSRLSIGPVQFVLYYESSAPGMEPPGSTVELAAIVGEGSGEGGDEDVGRLLDEEATVRVAPGVLQRAMAEASADAAAEADATTEATEAEGKGKRGGGMFGGLLRFGRKRKEEASAATTEEAAEEAAAVLEGEEPVEEPVAEAVEEAVEEEVGDVDDGDDDEVDYEEGDYAAGAELDVEFGEEDEKEEAGSGLGDFFKQFD